MPSLSGVISASVLYCLLPSCPSSGLKTGGTFLLALAQRTQANHFCKWIILQPALDQFIQDASRFGSAEDLRKLRELIETLGFPIVDDAVVQGILAEVGRGGEDLEALYAARLQLLVLSPLPGIFEQAATQIYQDYGLSIQVWDQAALAAHFGWSEAEVAALVIIRFELPPEPPVAQSAPSRPPASPSTALLGWLMAQLLFLTRSVDFISFIEPEANLVVEFVDVAERLATSMAGLVGTVVGFVALPAAASLAQSSPRQGVASRANQLPASDVNLALKQTEPRPNSIEPVNLTISASDTRLQVDAAGSDLTGQIGPTPEAIQADSLLASIRQTVLPQEIAPIAPTDGNKDSSFPIFLIPDLIKPHQAKAEIVPPVTVVAPIQPVVPGWQAPILETKLPLDIASDIAVQENNQPIGADSQTPSTELSNPAEPVTALVSSGSPALTAPELSQRLRIYPHQGQ